MCLQEIVETKCKCYFTGFPSLVNSGQSTILPCLNETQLQCFARLDFSSNISSYFEPCEQKCPLECSTIKYETHLSSVDSPSIENFDLFKKDQAAFGRMQTEYKIDLSSFDLYKKYFYSIKVFYPSIKYTYISESPQMTPYGLVSSLGGSLGMFLGFSVFSLIELLEISFTILMEVFYRK